MEFKLPELPYAYNSLEPYIDETTMTIHHTKHHQGYVNKLKEALAKHEDLQEKSLEELLSEIDSLPEEVRTAVRNNGGGHHNHSLFWNILTPKKTEPSEKLLERINEAFGDYDSFVAEFSEAGLKRFGSGWAWLVVNKIGTLEVISTANQDSPLMEGKKPLLGLDVWEHAYYLSYQNKRADYIQNFWYIVNWDQVEKNLLDK
jgi:Fe-Mn family superoxide dismutase